MKKTLSIILAILMIVTTIPMAFAADVVASGECGANVTWALDSDGVLTISGEGAVESKPWKDYKDSIKTIVIEEGITELIHWAFQDYQAITEVFISSTVKKLKAGAFSGCTSLKEVVFTGDIILNQYAFENCTSLKTVIFYSDVEFASSYIFDGCINLTEVIFYGDATFGSSYTFRGCTNLKEVIFYGDVTVASSYTFYGCTNLTEFTFGGEVKIDVWSPFFFVDDFHSVNVHVCGTQENWEAIAGQIKYNKCPVKNATPHYCEKIEKVDATCTEDGYTVGIYCSDCKEYISGHDVIPATNHKDTLVQVDAKAPTCTEIGWEAYEYCTACDYTTYVERAIDPDAHDIVVDEAVAPDCANTGLTKGQHCSRCNNATIAQEVIPALNHKDTLVKVDAKAPTCTEIGWEAYEYCTACTYTTYKEIPATGEHIDADGDTMCDNGGEQLTCEDCGRPVHDDSFAQNLICMILMLINLIKTMF